MIPEKQWRLVPIALICIASTSCLQVRDDEGDAGGDGCEMCHSMNPDSGAHQLHMSTGGPFGAPGMTCEDCHRIPGEWFSQDHLDAVVDVVFADGGLATAGGAEPYFDGASCVNVYCHGGTLSGGSNPAPRWDDTEQVSCGDCHGLPPLDPHPDDSACASCHASAYLDGGLSSEIHLNGNVDLASGDGGV
ncbi:MAG: CxxxxCH/CxxCH domain-containing protein [Polyangia bacterium]